MVLFGSCTAISVVLLSILLLLPLDPSVIVGDFTPTKYTGKANPLADDSIRVQDFYFESGTAVPKDKCHAWLYTKRTEASSAPLPVIIMAGGLGTQKDFGLDRYASKFVEDGDMAVFLFDYRNFGASTGVPRNWISPGRHLEDYRAAMVYLHSTGGLDGQVDTSKIGLWGTSFSGGHVLELLGSSNPLRGVKAIVSQVPHLSGERASKQGLKTRGIFKMLRMALSALQDAARTFVGLSPVSVRIIDGTGKELALMSVTPTEHDKYMAKQPPPAQKLGGWQNQAVARFLIELRWYNPLNSLQEKFGASRSTSMQQTTPPVLLIGAKEDRLCSLDLIQQAHDILPNSHLMIREGSHFDIYEPWNHQEVGAAMTIFFRSNLS